MKAAVGLLVLLVGVSYSVKTYCDGRQDGAQCYGALRGSVDIQLMKSTSELPRYQLLKNSLKILDVKNNQVNMIGNRSTIIPSNGTFRLNNLSSNDSGNYSLKTFDSDGKSSGQRTLQLFIQAPVSSVLLVSECLSQGEMKVSCSSEGGDSPQYSWTLDGRTLTDAELLSVNNESNIITLKQHVSGRLACSVRNNVSKEERISTCGYFPMVSIVLSAAVIYLVVGVALICAQRKKQNNRPTKQKEDDQKVTDADVRVMKQQGNWMEQTAKAEAEVEYGQVKFSKRPRHTELRGDDCMYAKIQKVS
ncbi:hepatocyte cell adhesion molecule-like [Astatotilapia calliptera]|uniref:hepatocyte cell adhesion molecule-like n=1 Tax=Astatotilapia calliptera TaxID=8154 RepID=UPI000E3FAB62|nr:hepatocyte cell adhesion molecule-like [Astatotilapia calliptera]